MADIELVIKMPESIWVAIQNGEYCGILDDRTYNAIKNGTTLPKGHGRLIDADDIALIDEQFHTPSDYYVAESAINDAPTIVDADTESEGEG